MRVSLRRLASFVVFLLTVSTAANADQRPSDKAPNWGTASPTVAVVSAFEFQPYEPGLDGALTPGPIPPYRRSASQGFYWAALHLPSGASATALELDGCVSGGVPIHANVKECAVGAGCSYKFQSLSVFPEGCSSYGPYPMTAFTVDNLTKTYFVEVQLLDATSTFGAVRIYYNLQVSPAPNTARFTDVPTSHPFFQFIEALAASGITAGCSASPPQYCPDAPLTRGQMAVFFAGALGLHWAP